ncbi:MAG: Putative histidine kinase HHK6p, partial [Tremellales sp. Tagirdzhanova-0007]
SDQDELDSSSNAGGGFRPRSPIRQDGILLAGFDVTEVGTRRVGKSLLRTLKLHSCRVVVDIQYANLIIAPEGLMETSLADLARKARPGVHIIILATPSSTRTTVPNTPALTPSTAQASAQDFLLTVPTTYLKKPLRPSVIKKIVKPADYKPAQREVFVSAVVGGPDAITALDTAPGSDQTSFEPTRPLLDRGSSISTLRAATLDPEILPSPPASPGIDDMPDNLTRIAHSLPPFRPVLNQHASDPLPTISESPTMSAPSGSNDPGDGSTNRPSLSEANSMPSVHESGPDDPLKVLVVEDNVVNRKILTTMLKRTACHYAEAVDGRDAVTQFLTFSPDLVLLDINMPHKDGFTAAAEMRQIEITQGRKRATIIAVTALSGEAQKRRGILECGIDTWRTKPVSIKQLKADVERLKLESE